MQSKMNQSAEAASVLNDIIKSAERTIRDSKTTETKFINNLKKNISSCSSYATWMKHSKTCNAFKKLTGIMMSCRQTKINLSLLTIPILETKMRNNMDIRYLRDSESTFYSQIISQIHDICFSNGQQEPMLYVALMRKITIEIDDYLDSLDKYTVGVLNVQLILDTLLEISTLAQQSKDQKLNRLSRQVVLTIKSFNDINFLSPLTVISVVLVVLPKQMDDLIEVLDILKRIKNLTIETGKNDIINVEKFKIVVPKEFDTDKHYVNF